MSRQANELSLLIRMLSFLTLLVIMMEIMLTLVVDYSFLQNLEFGSRFGASNSKSLGVDLVESIDKGSILCLDTTTNR